MLWCNRRQLLSLGSAGLLAACGFAPAYGPGGGATRLQGQVALAEPATRADYLLNRRLEERLSRASAAAYSLRTKVALNTDGLGTTPEGNTTRVQLIGQVRYELWSQADDSVLFQGDTRAFTGYSTTGSTVATLAAARDAETRLMTMLADQIVDRLVLGAAELLQQ